MAASNIAAISPNPIRGTANRSVLCRRLCRESRLGSVLRLRNLLAKAELSSSDLCSLEGGTEIKEATKGEKKISSLETASLLLVTIPNVWHTKKMWVTVTQAFKPPAVYPTCHCPPLPSHLLAAWCCLSPAPAICWLSSSPLCNPYWGLF